MAKILITGVGGFIGGTLARHLALRHELVGLGAADGESFPVLPLRLPHPDLDGLVAAMRPDVCIHCAGPATVGPSLADPEGDFAASVPVLFQLLNSLRRHSPACQVLFPSSAAVYGQPERLPVAETAPARPISPYGYHKLVCETLLAEFREIYGLPTTVLRIFTAYGPGLRKQLLWDLCRKARTGAVELSGTGAETRDFLHVADLARLVALLVDQPPTAPVLNAASGQSAPVARVAGLVLAALGRANLRPTFSGHERPGDPAHWRADVSAIASLGFQPRIHLEEGISDYARWFLRTVS